ncbi:MAG: hypothetical protein MR748_09380 [Clostridiales bacterium]|nr:hypothetical protein [Clostridiales bacterium]
MKKWLSLLLCLVCLFSFSAAALAEDATEEQVLPAIHLFATENLSVEE